MTPEIDRIRSKVGARRKECEFILRECTKFDRRALTEADKAQLWDALMNRTREIFTDQRGTDEA